MIDKSFHFSLESDSLRLEARRVSWDSELLGYPVAEIVVFELNGVECHSEFQRFASWVEVGDYGMISCRLPHERLSESEILERNGFRFIEMVLHPTIDSLQDLNFEDQGILVSQVEDVDIRSIGEIAEKAFRFERFHIDPYLSREIGNTRYGRWIINCQNDNKQQMLKAMLGDKIIGFFLVEYKMNLVYWHLTAMSPEFQGRGLGERVWSAMLAKHKADGYLQILTTISARNTPVLNLYSKLNFRFRPPEMTFHWNKLSNRASNVLSNTMRGS